jgi:hypothetical protein
MANTSIEDHQRINKFLPTYDFCAAYEIRIDAPTFAVYERLLSTDFSEAWAGGSLSGEACECSAIRL